MNHRKNRRRFGAEFKAKVALEALSERQTLRELADKYAVHPNQISTWKKQLLQDSAELFKRGPDKVQKDQSELIDELYKRLGQQQVELDWLKKKSGLSWPGQAHAHRIRLPAFHPSSMRFDWSTPIELLLHAGGREPV